MGDLNFDIPGVGFRVGSAGLGIGRYNFLLLSLRVAGQGQTKMRTKPTSTQFISLLWLFPKLGG